MPSFDPTEETHEDKAIEKHSESGRKKFSEEIGKAQQRDDRELAERKERAMAPTGKDEKTGIEYLSGRIFEPRCHVCQHPHRDWIEMMLIKGASYKGLQQRVPPLAGHDKLDRRSIANHHKTHMDLQDTAIRAILEREADLQAQDYKEGVEDAITKRGVLEVMMRTGFADIIAGVTTVEPRDLLQLVKILGDMDQHQNQVGLDEARSQVQLFIQAIKNVCDLETQAAIADEVRKLRHRENIDTKFENIMTPVIETTGYIEIGEVSDAIVIQDPSS